VDLEIFDKYPALESYPGGFKVLDKYPALVLHFLVDLGDFGQIPGPSSSLFRRVRVLRGAFSCISYRRKLLQHKSIRVQCTKSPGGAEACNFG
jgi:hypothetical protein